MAKTYDAPQLLGYGSVAAVTASFVKCTPMPDSQGWGHTHATDSEGNKMDGSDQHANCLPDGQLTP